MSDLRLVRGHEEDEVTRGLRGLYAAPSDEAYWSELEARIMHRIASVELGWWAELDSWTRPALLAAAALILACTAALFRAHEVDRATAYDALLAPVPGPTEAVARPMLQDQRDGTVRYVLSRD
ncbi:MAG: hypothetical protein KGL93_08335 [Gemmatimonadota bacterium]|nr:hypothetical protein [Gemmatimonadota bacterium]HEU4990569.1 hypothetical protein [Gemmatimonadaceae bacterium]